MNRATWLTAAFAILVMTWLAKTSDSWSESFSLTGQRGDYNNQIGRAHV
jgi:hypothetical protein